MRRLLFIAFCICVVTLKSQHANYWYFGNSSGLNFNINPPNILNNGMINNPDNVSTMSDSLGNLLFYSDGSKVWTKNHSIMTNGSGLLGNQTAGQCALIVPIPCSLSRYFIFYPTEFASPGYLRYSIVDMSANSGFGAVEVITKNTSFGSGWTEKLCAYFNSSGNFYWLLAHKWGSADFVAFKITSQGISTQSVVSTIGSIHNCGTYSGTHDAMGQLTFSPDGRKLVNAITCQDKYELFDFNLTTGVLSNSISILGNGGSAWGTAFSKNGLKLYTNSIFGTSIFQYDISSTNASTIQASKIAIATYSGSGYNCGYMELGPDQKIYVAQPYKSFLGVINNPDNSGLSCAFSPTGQTLGSATSTWGLSRIAYNIAANQFGNISFTVLPSNYCIGQTATISLPSGNTYSWSNGATATTQIITVNASSSFTIKEISGCKTTIVKLIPSECTSINTLVTSNREIKLYPNPSSETIRVEFSTKNVEKIMLFDLNAQLIESKIFQEDQRHVDFNISALQPGVYFIKTELGDKVFFLKE